MIEVSIQSDLKDVKKKLSKTNLDMIQIMQVVCIMVAKIGIGRKNSTR